MKNVLFSVPLYTVHVGNEELRSPVQKTFQQAVELMVARNGCYIAFDREVGFLANKSRNEPSDDVLIFVFGSKLSLWEARKRFAKHPLILEDINMFEESGIKNVAYNQNVKTIVPLGENMVLFSLAAQECILNGIYSLNGGQIVWREPIFRPFVNLSDAYDGFIEYTLPRTIGELRFQASQYTGIAVCEKVFFENGTSDIHKVLHYIVFRDKILNKYAALRKFENTEIFKWIVGSQSDGFLLNGKNQLVELPKDYLPVTLNTMYSWVE